MPRKAKFLSDLWKLSQGCIGHQSRDPKVLFARQGDSHRKSAQSKERKEASTVRADTEKSCWSHSFDCQNSSTEDCLNKPIQWQYLAYETTFDQLAQLHVNRSRENGLQTSLLQLLNCDQKTTIHIQVFSDREWTSGRLAAPLFQFSENSFEHVDTLQSPKT